MPKRRSLNDAKHVEIAHDLDDVVWDKREGCRTIAAKARRRQRSYTRRMTDETVLRAQDIVHKIVE